MCCKGADMYSTNEDDLNKTLATRHGNGADYWASPDGSLNLERPISTISALMILSELRVPADHEAVQGAVNAVLATCRPDGRIRMTAKGSYFPCQNAMASAALCRHGYAQYECVQAMLNHLLANRYEDGGWRCNKFFFGRGEETNHSNPGVTLAALDAFRFTTLVGDSRLDSAVETLLYHWTVRKPIGPCHYGMGSLFMQVEYPFFRYNLFYYVYVLSFYPIACRDPRFLDAAAVLSRKLDSQGRMVIERPNRKLAQFDICRAGQPSTVATERYAEIIENMIQFA